MRQQFSGIAKLIGFVLLLGVLAIAGGCGRTTRVTGKVTYQGQTVIHGSVIFIDAANKARSSAIKPDGSYDVEGVGLGQARIAVISRDPSKGRSVLRGEQPARGNNNGETPPNPPPTGWFPLPDRFEDPLVSGLSCIVDSSRVSHDIEMK